MQENKTVFASLSKLVVKPVGSHLLPWTIMATDYWDQILGVLKRCVNAGSKFRNGPRPTLVSTLHIHQSAQAFRRTHCSSAANFCTPPSQIWFTWQIKRRYFAFSVKKHCNGNVSKSHTDVIKFPVHCWWCTYKDLAAWLCPPIRSSSKTKIWMSDCLSRSSFRKTAVVRVCHYVN